MFQHFWENPQPSVAMGMRRCSPPCPVIKKDKSLPGRHQGRNWQKTYRGIPFRTEQTWQVLYRVCVNKKEGGIKQRFYFLKQLQKYRINHQRLVLFYSAIIESIKQIPLALAVWLIKELSKKCLNYHSTSCSQLYFYIGCWRCRVRRVELNAPPPPSH